MSLKIVVIVICFFSNVYVFLYARQILPGFRRPIFFVGVVVFNTVLLFLSYAFSSYYISYLVAIMVFTGELYFLSKAKIMQAFFIGVICIFHVVLVHLLIVVLLAWYYKIVPLEVLLDESLYYSSICLTFAVAVVILSVFRKLVEIEDVKNISSAFPYSLLISCSAVLIVLYNGIFSLLLMSPVLYPNTILILISTCVISAMLFYVFLEYNITLSGLGFFKNRVGDFAVRYKNGGRHLKDLVKLVFTDNLTGCYSGAYIKDFITKLSQVSHTGFCIVYIDIDDLKQVNGEFGYIEGDRYIKNMCTVITHHLRSDDILARIDGDEFILFLNYCAKENAHMIMARVEEHIVQWNYSQSKYPINISYGIVYVDSQSTQIEVNDFIGMANEQMMNHRAKKQKISKKTNDYESCL